MGIIWKSKGKCKRGQEDVQIKGQMDNGSHYDVKCKGGCKRGHYDVKIKRVDG